MFQGTGALAFNAAFYLQTNPDVFQAIQNGTFQGSALDHFVQFGQFEGRDPNQFFDTEFYLANNTDVLVAIADPANPSVVSAFQHFVMFGSDEGVVRAPSAAFASFNADTYFAQNPDLQAAFGNLTGEAREDALFAHFVEFGVNENRPGSGVDTAPTVPGVPGQVFALTTAIDTVNGTADNDLIIGNFSSTSTPGANPGDPAVITNTSTLNTGDVVNGGAGFDTLRVNATQTGTAAPTLIGVELVDVRAASGATASIGLGDSTGVQQLSLTNSEGSAAFTGVTAPVGINVTNSSGAISVAYATGVASPAAGQNVSLNGAATGSSVTVGNASTFNLTATGANTLGALTGSTTAGSALSTVNVGGNGSLVLTTALAASVTTLNASANSGGVDVAFQGTKDVTATGGSGDDTFRFGSTLTVKDTVNGGAGFDTVVVNAGNFSSATAAAAFNGLKSIERVEFVDIGATVLDGATFTNTGITNLLFNGAGNDTINNAGAARTYEFGTDNGGTATFSMTAGQTELNLALLGEEGDIDAAVVVDDITVALPGATAGTVSTINLVSEGDLDTTVTDGVEQFTGAVFNSVGVVSAVSGSTVNISGEGNLDIEGFANVVNVDASGFTGLLVIEGSQVPASALTAFDSAAAFATSDVFTLGEGRTTIQFDSGRDSGVFTTVGTDPLTAVTTFSVDVINNFTAGEDGDILDFTGSNTFQALTAEQLADVATAGSLQDAAAAAANLATGSAAWTAFEFDGEVYALYDAAQSATAGFDAANDVLVQLAGIEIGDLDVANFA